MPAARCACAHATLTPPRVSSMHLACSKLKERDKDAAKQLWGARVAWETAEYSYDRWGGGAGGLG